ncbi:50S ribosomal protein L4 [Candidatus Daviesbacteria bacterium RIFCSPLOWO2_02_FULL_40_8]|uniref:Large ribosomal subunit protein uL4 n=1 Tax=Candidatus Daviesbacteria bacterium RIFCSPLOWO2_01_FULL_40_24 TaxID=1797787 RepID=A0A1F5MJV1_9BACT|nr:MAG: 50S ribosomal protein L4 [Candidatus Daviesbacteria bacterium RIFCSPHIGHO2_01_FULL_41_45]OGE35380.1 MAG: 50S ribosomal protein L4 [Candidatus Daviesbacteria bacterium RIFCSPHIGHO2_02_FULL_41_14]OGE65623.1 MAG: 50S ribosomal protein L4 [Candidatus Daviesbacteria bacterium RIFCSPLOWO2_01_FULL_40_24]OGE66302.1 MAG: 50S ribosomal protein L4 [Candidatus Daviesbacteria bacterium RIFCSPLOWO2_02_FULL_40_8]
MPVKKAVVGLSVPMYSLDGKVSGNLDLPKQVFGEKVNRSLLAQAVRIYLNNQTAHFANTKTRSEVRGSTRKIYKQKGTGGARHGSNRAPIFVGGGIALGPKSRKVILDFPQKMRKAAIISALSLKTLEGEVLGINGLEKASGKTSQFDMLMKKLEKKSTLFILGERNEIVQRAVKNLGKISVVTAGNLNTLEILKHKTVIISQDAVEKLGEQK